MRLFYPVDPNNPNTLRSHVIATAVHSDEYRAAQGPLRHGRHMLAYEIHGDVGVPCLLMHGLLLDSLLNHDLARRFVGEGEFPALEESGG
jgi:hypothetical protein